MSDENDSFRFDIDSKDAVNSVMNLQKKISELGESDLSGLISGFTELALPIAAVGTAVFAVKKAFDFSLEGAQLERINQQFNLLAESAGQSGDLLKEKISESIGPTNNLEDAIKSANKALISLGPELSKNIPQYFDIARKAALAFGGDINERFEQISQAVLVGNTRMLRGIGLKVDATKAEQAYAKSIGVTVDQLSQQGKQQAISNAILDAANTKYKDIKANQNDLDIQYKSFKNAVNETAESVYLAFNKMFGPAFSGALKTFTGLLKSASTELKAGFGTGVEKVSAQIEVSKSKVEELTKKINDMGGDVNGDSRLAYKLQKEQAKLDQLIESEERLALKEAKRQSAAGAIKPEGDSTNPNVDKEKAKLDESKFQGELLQIKANRIKDELELETNEQKYIEGLEQQEFIINQQYENKIAQINTEVGEGKKYTAAQAALVIEQIEQEKTAKLKVLVGQENDAVMRAYDNRVKYATDSASKEIAQAQKVAAETKKSINDGAVLMQTKLDVTKGRSIEAFKAMAAGQKSASEIAKTFVFGSLGDIAEARGELHLANGLAEIFAGNPAGAGEVAQGGALIALGAALQSQAGGAGGGGVPSGGGGGGASPSSAQAPTTTSSSQLSAEAPQQGKSVTVQVMGHYFETDQARQSIMDIVRGATDATTFKYEQIGVR